MSSNEIHALALQAGVPDNFMEKWLRRCFREGRSEIELPAPWCYRPVGKLRWTPDLTIYKTIAFSEDDIEEARLQLL